MAAAIVPRAPLRVGRGAPCRFSVLVAHSSFCLAFALEYSATSLLVKADGPPLKPITQRSHSDSPSLLPITRSIVVYSLASTVTRFSEQPCRLSGLAGPVRYLWIRVARLFTQWQKLDMHHWLLTVWHDVSVESTWRVEFVILLLVRRWLL